MNCTSFELEAQQLLDERQTALTPELQQHADTCPECRAFWQSQRALLAATRSWSRAVVPERLLDHVLAELSQPTVDSIRSTVAHRRTESSTRKPHQTAWIAVASTAVVMFLAVTLLPFSPSTSTLETQTSIANLPRTSTPVAVTTPTDADPTLVAETLSGIWQGVHEEYRGISQQTVQVFEEFREFPESSTLMPKLPASESSSHSTTPQATPAWLRLTRPVSDRVGQAFDFLNDAVPSDTPQT